MIHIIIGTKAQLVKMAPIMARLQDRNIEYTFIFMGHHKEMINELLNAFKKNYFPLLIKWKKYLLTQRCFLFSTCQRN